MPYKTISDLPSAVKEKFKDNPKKQRQFMHVVNTQLAAGKSDPIAYASAWAAVGKLEENILEKIYDIVKATFTAQQRRDLAGSGAAMPDGGFPIRNAKDLENAIHDFGRANDKTAVKAHIKTRAKALDLEDKLPDNWVGKAWEMEAEITKLDNEQQLVYAWASIIKDENGDIVDKQGDVITEDELVKAAHEYLTNSRESHVMHKGEKTGHIVESMVFTPDVQKALGVDLKKTGWFVVMKIEDPKAWKSYKDGTYKMLSIGGQGIREAMDE